MKEEAGLSLQIPRKLNVTNLIKSKPLQRKDNERV